MPAAEINAIHMADARCPAEVPVAGGSLAKTVSVKDSVSVIDSSVVSVKDSEVDSVSVSVTFSDCVELSDSGSKSGSEVD